MASIGKDTNGRKRILFVAPDGKRKTVRLGKATQKQAEAVKLKIEKLVSAKITGQSPDDDVSRWVAGLDETLTEKLAKVGLVEQRASTSLKGFLDAYIDGRTDVKPATFVVWGHTKRDLVKFFGPNKPLRDINQGDADDFRLFLLDKEKLSENTTRKRCAFAKQFLRAAMKRRLIPDNPFVDLVCTLKKNTERQYFITPDEADKVIECCIDAQWRLLFALSRYGGLRCPSEHLALKWGDEHRR